MRKFMHPAKVNETYSDLWHSEDFPVIMLQLTGNKWKMMGSARMQRENDLCSWMFCGRSLWRMLGKTNCLFVQTTLIHWSWSRHKDYKAVNKDMRLSGHQSSIFFKPIKFLSLWSKWFPKQIQITRGCCFLQKCFLHSGILCGSSHVLLTGSMISPEISSLGHCLFFKWTWPTALSQPEYDRIFLLVIETAGSFMLAILSLSTVILPAEVRL